MEDRRGDLDPLGQAAAVVAERGRMYQRGKYRSLRVFSRDLEEVELLQSVFGGAHYKHGTGYIWAVGRKAKIDEIISLVYDAERSST